ncbi:MAG TPA: CBS domain-containing protein [Thermoplasmata archaeon]|nr:CBS domain-containing protein [Thermoplasmata archaeon]
MEKEFLSLPPNTSVFEAAKAMARVHRAFVIVSASDAKLIRIVTDWDLLSKVVAEARDPEHMRLEDIMSRPPLRQREQWDRPASRTHGREKARGPSSSRRMAMSSGSSACRRSSAG